MTRDEAKATAVYYTSGSGKYIDGLIEDIFNDHEIAIEILMKANEEEISRHFNEVKAKDEGITELTHTVSGLNEMYLEAKEEIERLKAESKQAYIEGSKSCDDLIRFYITKIEELSK